MAYDLIWSPASRDDLHDIVSFISNDSRERAETFGFYLISETDKLHNFPEVGRIVPEYRIPTYRVNHEAMLIEIARVWHAARGGPEV